MYSLYKELLTQLLQLEMFQLLKSLFKINLAKSWHSKGFFNLERFCTCQSSQVFSDAQPAELVQTYEFRSADPPTCSPLWMAGGLFNPPVYLIIPDCSALLLLLGTALKFTPTISAASSWMQFLWSPVGGLLFISCNVKVDHYQGMNTWRQGMTLNLLRWC